ncbi:MAG: hypothetical protein IJT38_04115 [Clostridia bacterium]|nr:hypothetical protein [Clostridia bacterium]
MKSALITVTSDGQGIIESLSMTERLGTEHNLDKKSVLHLRLLAEELFGMLRGIAGDVEASYWIEAEDKKFELHMKSDVDMSLGMRDQFLSASSSGKNEAAKGFMGKLRVMIANMLLSSDEPMPYAMIDAMSTYSMAGISGDAVSVWSLSYYVDEIQRRMNEAKEAEEVWDELEKSIVANIADDIKVTIKGKNVEIVLFKSFN